MNQDASPQDLPPPPRQFRDRRTGLLIFGILEILLGAACLLMVGIAFLGQVMLSRKQETALNSRMLLPAIFVYFALAGAFVWLGIGSILCRRWARALLLILAWIWLCIGVFTVPLTAFFMPRILSSPPPNGQALPHGLLIGIMVFQLIFITLTMVVLPGALVLFYQSRHVKATCEARDPVGRWTDACPLPVLGVACMSWLGAVSMLIFPVAYNGALPVFGTILSGLSGTLLALGLAGLWFWLGQSWYRVKAVGWWVLLVTLIILAVSNVVTFSRLDLMELYHKMGYPEAQIEMIRRQGIVSNGLMVWGSLVWLIPTLGYLFWVKRSFRSRQDEPPRINEAR